MNLPWIEAITKVLESADNAMHYKEIAEKIIENNFREKVGVTPAATVAAQFSRSFYDNGDRSPFIKVGRGMYYLRSKSQLQTTDNQGVGGEELEENAIINAFGMFWQRDRVLWIRMPKLLGKQQIGADAVNFSDQKGIYILYDGRDVVYVGRSVDRPLGTRLFEHTQDRLQGRWDKFSWFGIYSVEEEGSLNKHEKEKIEMPFSNIIGTLEALLIEGLEPPQNRKRGDGFNAMEFIQADDPEAAKKQKLEFWKSMEPS